MLEFPSAWDAAMWLSNEDPCTVAEYVLDLENLTSEGLRYAADTLDDLCCGTGDDVFLIDGRPTLVIASWGH